MCVFDNALLLDKRRWHITICCIKIDLNQHFYLLNDGLMCWRSTASSYVGGSARDFIPYSSQLWYKPGESSDDWLMMLITHWWWQRAELETVGICVWALCLRQKVTRKKQMQVVIMESMNTEARSTTAIAISTILPSTVSLLETNL